MRLLALLAIFFLVLTGCSSIEKSEELKGNNLQNEQINERETQESVEDLETEANKKLQLLKNNLDQIKLDKNDIDKKVDSIEKSALELVDECIDTQKKKGLPIYECTKLLKP